MVFGRRAEVPEMALTAKVMRNNRVHARRASRPAWLKAIKHVIYVVKENRTYDQVLGDLPQGNGNPRYCIFGREVTPNLHALAERFVLMDNFYDCGEVSGDGWAWSWFDAGNPTKTTSTDYKKDCLPCHVPAQATDWVYTSGYPTLKK